MHDISSPAVPLYGSQFRFLGFPETCFGLDFIAIAIY